MANNAETEKKKFWYNSYLGYLCYLAGIGTKSGKPDLGALAELRSSARGGAFEMRALRHVAPYLEEDDTYYHAHVRVGMLVGQLFAAYRPDSPASETDSKSKDRRWRSIGRLLGEARKAENETRNKKTGDTPAETADGGEGKRALTALERHLHTVVATDFDRLGPRLRGTLARLKQAGVALELADYSQLLSDLGKWTLPDKHIQYRWVSDFYRNTP